MIVVDAEDRENEGDFICAAEKASPEIVNFMITHGRGQLCMPILPEVSQRLALASDGRAATPRRWAPTTPCRSTTARPAPASPPPSARKRSSRSATRRATPADFVRPGHLFPLVAKEGGVLRRAGHTEAAVDLARMAGLMPAGVLCEILNETGDRANRDQLAELARRFELPIISIEQLIAHRRVREKLVYREAEAQAAHPLRHRHESSPTA